MSNKEPLNLVYATDSRGVLGLAVSGWSVLKHLPPEREVNFWILEEGLKQSERLKVAATFRAPDRHVTVSFMPIPEGLFDGLLRSKTVPLVAYARLVMGEMLPSNVARCVYMDIDTVCLTSLAPLHDIDLSGSVIGAVPNSSSLADSEEQFQRLGIEGRRYFNSGVLVCDLLSWRERNVTQESLAFARASGSRLILYDQDTLNVVLRDLWVDLPDRWNRWAASGSPLQDCIVHYTMSPKPWHVDYRGRGRDIFWGLLDETAFRGHRPFNPLGLGRVARWVRSRVPYGPTVWRTIRQKISRSHEQGATR